MESLKKGLLKWGVRYAKIGNIGEILRYLMEDQNLSQVEIAKKFGVTPPAIGYWVRRFKLTRKHSNFDDYIKSIGYKDIKSYFTSPENSKKTFSEMSKETGFSYVTISSYFRSLADSIN